jgi:two-component system chemotaxis response regulator CheB
MIVDDSAVVRGMIARELETDNRIKIVASAMNGKVAIDELKRKKTDVMLLDVEMPEMDGLSAIPELLKVQPDLKIIMVSSLTGKNTDHALQALRKGASDCIAKPSNARDRGESEHFFVELKQKILGLCGLPIESASKKNAAPVSSLTSTGRPRAAATPLISMLQCRAIAIGSSTGGPQALIELFRQLSGKALNVPVFVAQHMPANFTKTLAAHIASASKFHCAEAEDGQIAEKGKIYVAPGDYHLVPEKDGQDTILRLNQNPPVNFCRPAVDPMFDALAGIYKNGLLSIVLTGMGQDGRNGAEKVQSLGGKVVVQDRDSCIVWGMPKAVWDAGHADAEMLLPDIAGLMARLAT